LLCPVYAPTVDQLQPPTARGGSVDVKAQVEVIATATGSKIVKSTIHMLELGPNRREKLIVEERLTVIRKVCYRKVEGDTWTQEGSQ
jgi:hypothetical protein